MLANAAQAKRHQFPLCRGATSVTPTGFGRLISSAGGRVGFGPNVERTGVRGEGVVWLSTKAAAAQLAISPRTLYRLMDQGSVVVYRFGRVFRIKQNDIDAYVDSQRAAPGTLGHLYERDHRKAERETLEQDG
jgi:excisionase family DNA binding protein